LKEIGQHFCLFCMSLILTGCAAWADNYIFTPNFRFNPTFPPPKLNTITPVPLVPMGYHCNSALLESCKADAQQEFSQCSLACNPYCGIDERYPNPPRTVACQLCRDNRPDCGFTLEAQNDSCRRTYGCPANYDCSADAKQPSAEYCCPSGQEACNSSCYKTCLSIAQRRNLSTCQCECLTHCLPPKIQDSETCFCKCPECQGGMVQTDARTCKCECPSGLTPCDGNCIDLLKDNNHCGSCGNHCQAGKSCCDGTCKALNTPENCGSCGNHCQAGQACCNGACSRLDTVNNCGSCGNRCTAGQTCCNGTCKSLNTPENCGTCGNRCMAGQTCCNGACTSLDTVNNCGTCGNHCRTGEGCCGGTCKPLNTNENCGSCSSVCAKSDKWWNSATGAYVGSMDSTCSSGKCACPKGISACYGFCCPDGWVCVGNDQNREARCRLCPAGVATGLVLGTGAVACCTNGYSFIGNQRVCN